MADATKHSDDEDIDTGAEIAGYAEQSVHSDVEDKDADAEMAEEEHRGAAEHSEVACADGDRWHLHFHTVDFRCT
jgi:hypothetical protein